MFTFKELYEAYLRCRKHKRNTLNALDFEIDLIENICDLETSLNTRTYRPKRSVCFITSTPKLREVFAADFSDRVIHHLIVPVLEAIFEPLFIYDSYSARKDKGIHHALKRSEKFSKSSRYYLQLDIRNFFYSIDKNILFKLLNKAIVRSYALKAGLLTRMNQDEVLWLLYRVIFHDVTQGAVLKGKNAFQSLPPHKTLFQTDKSKGLPIGNLSSQFFANVYLNGLDNFCKRELKCKKYLRYVDDFVIFDDSKELLMQKKAKIELYLKNELSLTLRDRYLLRPVNEGLDFLGYIIRPFYTLVRQRVVKNYKYKKAQYLSSYEKAQGRMDKEKIETFLSKKASFYGHVKHANSFKLIKKVGNIDEKDPFDYDRV